MKVLHAYDYGILGGVATQLLNRLRVLERAQEPFESHLLFAKDHGISRTLADRGNVTFEADPRRARQLVERHRFDAIVVIDSRRYLDAFDGLSTPPLVIEVHSTVENGLAYLESRRWRPAGFVVPSQYSAGLLRERFGYGRDEPIAVVPNSLDTTLFPTVDVDSVPRRPVVAWIGKLDDHKNWRGYLQILRELAGLGVSFEGWLVGGEVATATAEQEFLQALGSSGLASRVRWLPRVEYGAMHRLYAGVRQSGGLVVVTSRDESFGMTVLEALVCGSPVVASRVGAIPEIAPESEYFRLYDLGDYRNAAELAADLLGSRGKEARRCASAARTELLERYSSVASALRYRATIAGLIVNGPTASTAELHRLETEGGELQRLQQVVERLRPHLPHWREHPGDSVAFLEKARAILELRSYRLARVIATRRQRSLSRTARQLLAAFRRRNDRGSAP